MKILKKKSNFLKIKNINNGLKHKYKRQYRFLCFKLSIDNKEKLNLYKKQAELERKEHYEQRVSILKNLKKSRAGKQYDMTCVIFTYNHKNTIERAINSILEQNTHYAYLIKIIDDCSTDGTTDICLEYAQKYPERIELVTYPKNTNKKCCSAVFRQIKTEFYSTLDGDDYWCDTNKIEVGLNYLNSHSDVVMYLHDVKYHYRDKDLSLMHDLLHLPSCFKNPFDIKDLQNSHLSGRIYRNCIDFKKEYVNVRKRDGVLNEIFAYKGKCFYDDRIMSVYDKTTGGVWNSLAPSQQQYSSLYRIFMSCKMFKYSCDDIFIKKFNLKYIKFLTNFLGKRLGWFIWIHYYRYKCQSKMEKELNRQFNNIEAGFSFFSQKDVDELKRIAEE